MKNVIIYFSSLFVKHAPIKPRKRSANFGLFCEACLESALGSARATGSTSGVGAG